MLKMLNKDDYEKCVEFVLSHEGGYSDHEHDRGGATKYGISLRFLRNANINIDDELIINENDILSLSKEKAKSIYKKYWWDKYKYYLIDNIQIAAKLFDFSINMSGKRAHKLIQSAVNKSPGFPLKVDGLFGEKTLKEINDSCGTYGYVPLLVELKKEAISYYTTLVLKNENLKCFLKGWLVRANSTLK